MVNKLTWLTIINDLDPTRYGAQVILHSELSIKTREGDRYSTGAPYLWPFVKLS